VTRRILEINEVERTWIAGNQQVVRSFAIERGILPADAADVDARALDAAWAAWLEIHIRGQEDPNSIINAFGMALGQILVESCGLEWRIVTDAVTDVALYRRVGDIVIYPQNLVARRYVAGTRSFFVELVAETQLGLGRAAGPAPTPVAAPPAAASTPAPRAVSGRTKKSESAAGPAKPPSRSHSRQASPNPPDALPPDAEAGPEGTDPAVPGAVGSGNSRRGFRRRTR